MRARTGKIARLPGPIRHELNRCLHNGTLGKEFDIWLNELAEVQCVPAHCFPGRLVTEDNISAWRQGGFRDGCASTRNRAYSAILEPISRGDGVHRRPSPPPFHRATQHSTAGARPINNSP